jgi:hypothetical protein
MVRDFSKLMLRAFNAEADNLVRGLKPYKLDAAIDRLRKVVETIIRLGKTMQIQISVPYYALRVRELELTADFLQKQAEEKEAERIERERLREERKVQQELEREGERLDKERQHCANALEALVAKGDEAGAARLRDQLNDVQRAIEDVDYRAANIRAGYVYVISNIGSFGETIRNTPKGQRGSITQPRDPCRKSGSSRDIDPARATGAHRSASPTARFSGASGGAGRVRWKRQLGDALLQFPNDSELRRNELI